MKKKPRGTMAGSYSGSLDNPHWLNGRRVIYLVVPFAEKDAAKQAGARFNPAKRQWWIFADLDDRSPFAAWLPFGETVGAKVDRTKTLKPRGQRKPPHPSELEGERRAAYVGALRTLARGQSEPC